MGQRGFLKRSVVKIKNDFGGRGQIGEGDPRESRIIDKFRNHISLQTLEKGTPHWIRQKFGHVSSHFREDLLYIERYGQKEDG